MKYTLGEDYKKDNVDLTTYGINYKKHVNKIEIYGDEKLRNEILNLLNDREGQNNERL